MITHGSLFSGIGGFDLAAQWMGWENVFHCEINDFGQKVLKYHFPKAISYYDIKKTDFTIHRGNIDIISGGFPCQPFSSAGKRKGTEDDRHLWPEMLRAIREIQPCYVVGENVRGLTNWNGGLVFDQVQIDLENEGFEVLPFLLPACAVNAPHRRDRIWFIAYTKRGGIKRKLQQRQEQGEFRGYNSEGTTSNPDGTEQGNGSGENNGEKKEIWGDETGDVFRELLSNGITSDTSSGGISGHGGKGEGKQLQATEPYKNNSEQFGRMGWKKFPTQPPVCGGDDGLPEKLDGITFPKWRNESIKGLGNAIVPQVAYQLFKVIDILLKETK